MTRIHPTDSLRAKLRLEREERTIPSLAIPSRQLSSGDSHDIPIQRPDA